MKLLKEYAYVHTGYSFGGSLKNRPVGNTAILQMSNVCDSGNYDVERLARVNLPYKSNRDLLQDGDLVVRARGFNNRAMLIKNPPERLVCVAPLTFLQITNRRLILLGYLQWYFNLAMTQAAIADIAQLNQKPVRHVYVRDLELLRIFVPPIEHQQKIVDFFNLEKDNAKIWAEINDARLLRLENWLLRELHQNECDEEQVETEKETAC